MPRTRAYRIALIVVNLAGAIAGGLTQWGPGLGLDASQIGMIITALNILIVLGRQIADPSTPTLPTSP